MQRLSFILVLLGLALATQVRQNVVFRKVSEVTTTRSRWSLTFVIDLNPYVTVMKTVEGNINNLLGVIQTVVENRAPGTNGLVNDFRGLNNELKTLRETYFGVNARLGEYHALHTRTRRSLVPFIGQAFSFLFGTVSEGDLGAIKQNLHILRNNQVELAHVVQESLSLINVSRARIAEDRQTLNLIVSDMGALNDQIVNVTQRLDNRIFQLETLLPMYLQLDSMVEEIKQSLQKALIYVEHLQLQLNMLSIGKLSPSIISPLKLRDLLVDIQTRISAPLRLPGDPKADLWHFYKTLTCTTIVEEDEILVVVPVPLLDSNDDFDVYRVHNLPIPFNSSDGVMSGSVASYRLEAEAIAVNTQRTSFVLLTREELGGCSKASIGFCSIKSPVYPVSLNSFCITALFMKNTETIEQNCQTVVQLKTVLPMAEYLTDGNWIITTQRKLVFSLVCQENQGGVREIEVQPPLDIIRLPMSCSASNEYMSLMPYYQKESKFQVEDSISELLLNARVANATIWKPFHEKLPNFSAIQLPGRLQAVEKIPLRTLIAELADQDDLVEDTTGSYPAWLYAVVGTLVLVMILTALIYKCKGRCLRGSARWRGDERNSGAAAEAPGMQLVPVTGTGGGDNASRGMIPSAPLLRRDEEPMEVDVPPEAEPRPLPFARLFGGGGSSPSAPLPKPRE